MLLLLLLLMLLLVVVVLFFFNDKKTIFQEDVAEYKVEASNPAGKASSVANLVLAREFAHFCQ